MTVKINADTSDGLKFVSDTSGTVDIQSNGTTKFSVGTTIDCQGNELVLDADADTSIHASTDDQIDFKTGGTDRFVLSSANAKFNVGAYNAEATLTDASTISWDVSTSPVAKVTLGGNRTLGAATNAQAGQFVSILFIQDGTGSRTITFNAAYEHTEDTAPTLTTTANKGDLFVYRYNGSKFLEVGRNLNLTLS